VHVVALEPQLMPPPVTVPGPVTETVSVVPPLENVAVTLFEELIKMVHVVAVPPHAPLQPTKVAPTAGAAVSETVSLRAKLAEQTLALLPQLIAPASPLTLPVPVTVTLSWTPGAKVAVTDLAASIRTSQVVSVPPHAPLQPMNVAPAAGVAVSETVELRAKLAEQTFALEPQLIAPLSPLTLPLPVTATLSWTTGANVAVTDLAESIRTAQVDAVPAHAPPPQPVKTWPAAAAAVRTTVEFTD
jgi:hypothetical protein